ncbi:MULTISPECIES: TIGR03086 family metal-binding protein [Kitasatospora]|nr:MULTISPECIES: TIGR03086 family metal-binding protein [Kitasatospora]
MTQNQAVDTPGLDLVALDARALATARSLVDRIDPGMLGLATPCGSWTLGRLLAHMTGQNHGFAAAARGGGRDLADWADRPVGDDPAGVFAASVAEVEAAFAEEGVLERAFWLPEIRDGGPFPGRQAIGFHFLDYVVHGWDVAVSIGAEPDFAPGLPAAVLPIARQVPAGPAREAPGAAFAPALPSPAGAGDGDGAGDSLALVLRLLGRDPDWTAPNHP